MSEKIVQNWITLAEYDLKTTEVMHEKANQLGDRLGNCLYG